jgi:hypothetical protein
MGLLLLLPDQIGVQLLGAVWPTASTLILPATLAVTFAGISSGAATGLRALGAARRSLRAQLITSTAYVIAGLSGAVLNGALGSSWGVASGCLIGACAWWYQLRTALRLPSSPASTRTETQEKG